MPGRTRGIRFPGLQRVLVSLALLRRGEHAITSSFHVYGAEGDFFITVVGFLLRSLAPSPLCRQIIESTIK